MLRSWFTLGRLNAHAKDIAFSLKRIANALEEQNLARGGGASSFRALYEDKNSPEEAAIQFPTDEYFAELELREQVKRKHGGEAQDLSDEEMDDLTGSEE